MKNMIDEGMVSILECAGACIVLIFISFCVGVLASGNASSVYASLSKFIDILIGG